MVKNVEELLTLRQIINIDSPIKDRLTIDIDDSQDIDDETFRSLEILSKL